MSENQRIDNAFERLRGGDLPPRPGSLEQNVWRRIRHQSSAAQDWRPMYWPQWLTKPAFAAAFSVVSLISGVIVATNINSAEGAIVSSTESSRLSIFTENAPGLLRAPSTSHHP